MFYVRHRGRGSRAGAVQRSIDAVNRPPALEPPARNSAHLVHVAAVAKPGNQPCIYHLIAQSVQVANPGLVDHLV